MHYGGSGNRNLTPGDAIFHCHLYPHFAQGMWELWRVPTTSSNPELLTAIFPTHDIAGGTPNPAIVPVPGSPLPPMPTPRFAGYPFYIAGVPGHRPPQAPLDIDPDAYGTANSADTLMRHVIIGGERETGAEVFADATDGDSVRDRKKVFVEPADVFSPTSQTNLIAAQVENIDRYNVLQLAAKLTKAEIQQLPLDGTAAKRLRWISMPERQRAPPP